MVLQRSLDVPTPIRDLAPEGLKAMSPTATLSSAPRLESEVINGGAYKRFMIIVVLLSLIDPVRGEPTAHSLDRHPHDNTGKLESYQKKFLDSFALICSTSRVGGDTASAVCLEQHPLNGNVLRLARNLGVPQELVSQLQQVLDDLTAVAGKEMSFQQAESVILLEVINLTQDKIRFHLKKLREPDISVAVQDAISRMEANNESEDDDEAAGFRQWAGNLPALVSLMDDATPAQLIPHMKWASKAKWTYAEQIEALFCPNGEELPPWVLQVYKLGRYFAATKAMLKLATKQPDLFASVRVEAVQAPDQVRFSLGEDRMTLRMTLERLMPKKDPGLLMKRLGEIWLTKDPEKRFRQACKLKLTVHAEMQLLAFYDRNPDLTPRLLFMGTSKKACFLCNEFMSRHPLAMGVGACHQKLYPSWMRAPCSSAVLTKHKELLWNLSRHLEQTTLRDLETRLGIRRPRTLDSTAGPSLTTTGTISTGSWALELPLQSLSIDEEDSFSTATADGDNLSDGGVML